MVKGLYTAHTGMVNEMKRLDVMTNNLANADTYGYKKEGTTSHSFGEKLAYTVRDTSNYGLDRNIGSIVYGVHLGETYTDYSSGSFEVTDNKTDFAVAGNGFFAIAFEDKQGQASVKFTRDGAFVVNAEGYLVTKDGDHVLNMTGAVNRDAGPANWVRVDPTRDFEVDELGYIYQNDQVVGTMGLVDFANYDYIEKYGENLYNLVDGGQIVVADGSIRQGCLETSNVQVVDEMVNMITIQRAYEANQKVITSIDETLEVAVNQIGKV